VYFCKQKQHEFNFRNVSVNKNALIRYQVLDRCFRNTGRKYFWEDLLNECNKALTEADPNSDGIQRRQLFEDIRFMESEQGWGVLLERIRDGRKVYYRYEDVSFSINNMPLNTTEALKIRSALQVFSRFSGTLQFEWVKELIPMLETKFGLIEKKNEILNFENNIDLKGLDYLTPLFNAIIHEQVLDIKYKDFKNPDSYQIIFHPYFLKQYNSRWFVFGYNADNQIKNWNLALDRIVEIKDIHAAYIPSDTDWESYFYDIVGVTMPEKGLIQVISMKFTTEAAPYVLTKPLHPSQKHKTISNGLEVTIKVIPNIELERLILSFGEQIEVLSPPELRMRISKRVSEARRNYL
jgi:predicted DNA-binding transcriptional regulator YafY